jgi:histone acetyltransferase HTATIP
MVDLAASIYSSDMPSTRGLKKALIGLFQMRMAAIIEDEDAWEEYYGNRRLVKALHAYQCEMSEAVPASSEMLTPPATPTKKRKMGFSE